MLTSLVFADAKSRARKENTRALILTGNSVRTVSVYFHHPRVYREMILVLLVLAHSCIGRVRSLHCADHCSMISAMHQPFVIPSNCSSILASRCSVKLVFWYSHGYYKLTFSSKKSYEHLTADNRHFLMIETARHPFFSYEIEHECQETDDCARHFANKTIRQMTQRLFNTSRVYSDLQRVLDEQQQAAPSKDLACFDMSDAVRQCAVYGLPGSCRMVSDLIKHKFHRRSCLPGTHGSASLNIYDTSSFAMITITCNRLLCNGPITMAAVMRVLWHHRITDANGRLSTGSTHFLFSCRVVLCAALLLSLFIDHIV